MYGDGKLADHSVHFYQCKESPVHEHARHHRDDAWDRQAVVRRVEYVNGFYADDTYERRAYERAKDEAPVESHVAVARSEVHEVTRAYGYYASYGYHPEQTPRYVEYHREAHGRYGCRHGIGQIAVVWRHAEVFHKVVYAAHLDGYYYAERHGRHYHERVDGPRYAYADVAVEHVAHKVDQRYARNDEQGTGHERMPRCVAVCEGYQCRRYVRLNHRQRDVC